MKKKIVLILCLIVLVVVFLNVITYIQGNNLFYNYVKERYFPDILNLEEQFGIKDYKTKPQKIVIDDYTITMDQYFYNNDKAGGCFRVKVEKCICMTILHKVHQAKMNIPEQQSVRVVTSTYQKIKVIVIHFRGRFKI